MDMAIHEHVSRSLSRCPKLIKPVLSITFVGQCCCCCCCCQSSLQWCTTNDVNYCQHLAVVVVRVYVHRETDIMIVSSERLTCPSDPLQCDCSFLRSTVYVSVIGVYEPGGWGGLQPSQTRAKPLFFGQKLNFSVRSQQPKMKKKILYLGLLNEKTKFVPSSEIKCPKSGVFTNNITGWGEWG